uniref:Retrotransposon gag domain-containing protein n=1 Tax=Vitis vinifera TaxID=29760 RepID=A5BCR5_VITVI|nr:hypothetical protein VITISV_010774 [Vitis vinifera]
MEEGLDNVYRAMKREFNLSNFFTVDSTDPSSKATCSYSTMSPRQQSKSNSEDVFPEDEWLGFLFLGVKEARTNGLKRQISNFSAKENEKFYECWERYMEAINACPHHGFDTWLLVSYFYDGMSSSMKQLLETMCGGDFMSKNPEEAMDFLNYVAEVSRGWDEPNRGEVGRMKSQPNALNAKAEMYTLNEDIDMKAKVAAMTRRLEELEL